MTDKEILIKCILKAEKEGYKEHIGFLPAMPYCKGSADLLMEKIFWQRRFEIIFSFGFAKAFFGIDRWNKCTECFLKGFKAPKKCKNCFQSWQHYLQKLVLEENKFKYLERFLEK